MLSAESDRSGGEVPGQRGAAPEFDHGRGDPRRIGALEHIGVDAVTHEQPEVGPGQHHRSAKREELRSFEGKRKSLKASGTPGWTNTSASAMSGAR